jgi:hypothetical protein
MALGRLFSALPVRQGDAADQIEVYVYALEDVTHHALDAVVAQAIRGSHPKFSRKWAPTCAELGEAVADEMERVKRQMELAEEKLRIADNRAAAVRPKLIDERISDAKAKMLAEGRRFLFEAGTFSGLASRRRECPPGSIFVGILCAAYGPEGSLYQPEPQPVAQIDLQAAYEAEMAAADAEMQEILKADMFEPEAEQPAQKQEVADVEF